MVKQLILKARGGVLDFGLDGGVPPGPRDPYPCLGILLQKQAIFFLIFRKFFKNGPMFRDFGAKNGTHV